MFGRLFPALLLIAGGLLYASGFARGVSLPGWAIAILGAYAFVFPALLVWSYFLGPQKGRPIHFLQILVYSVFGACFAANAAGYISDSIFDIIAVALFAALGFFVTVNYRSIQSDYKLGIKRNFFEP